MKLTEECLFGTPDLPPVADSRFHRRRSFLGFSLFLSWLQVRPLITWRRVFPSILPDVDRHSLVTRAEECFTRKTEGSSDIDTRSELNNAGGLPELTERYPPTKSACAVLPLANHEQAAREVSILTFLRKHLPPWYLCCEKGKTWSRQRDFPWAHTMLSLEVPSLTWR